MDPAFLPGPGVPGLVSIVVPTYNRADTIGDTIESALAQTYEHFELIVIDDGSVDETRTVVTSYGDPRVLYFHQPNGGLASARNAGLARARGEFIAFLDSDDVWRPWKLAAQIQIFRRHTEVGLIWTDMSTFREAGQVIAERHLRTYYHGYNRVKIEEICERGGALRELSADAPADLADCSYYVGDIFAAMLYGNLVHPPTAIVRRERLRQAGGFEPHVTRGGGDDYHFYLRVAQHGPAAFLDAPAILYRISDRQMSVTNSLREAHGDLLILTHWRDAMAKVIPESVIRSRLAGAHMWIGAEELYAGNPRGATPHLWRSLRLSPNQPFVASLFFVSLLPKGSVERIRALKHLVRRAVRPATLLGAGLVAGAMFWLLVRLRGLVRP